MPFSTNTQTASQVRNHAVGKLVTSSATAAEATIACGFLPRKVVFQNVTDRINDVWYEGMASASSIHTVANGTVTLETTNGIAVANDGFTLTATTLVASKTYAWEAIG